MSATRRTLNVSLTPELHDEIREAVASGLFTSASEVVRAALRVWLQRETPDSAPGRSAAAEREGGPLPTEAEWRVWRSALMVGESALAQETLGDVAELFRAGIALERDRIRRTDPDADEATVARHLAAWLRRRAGADGGDGMGRRLSAAEIQERFGA